MKAMDMHFDWLHNQEQGQFWMNFANYWTKHHPVAHQKMVKKWCELYS